MEGFWYHLQLTSTGFCFQVIVHSIDVKMGMVLLDLPVH